MKYNNERQGNRKVRKVFKKCNYRNGELMQNKNERTRLTGCFNFT